jgi:hypothetical protein
MKILVNIVLIMFLSFLAAPTVVSMLQDDADVSMVYNLTEEEIQKEIKEVKAHHYFEFEYTFYKALKKSAEIKSENLQRHDNVFEEIFSPPPETV